MTDPALLFYSLKLKLKLKMELGGGSIAGPGS